MSAASESRVAVFGLGGVGKALLELLIERSPSLRLTGVADSRGALAGELDPRHVLEMKRTGPLPTDVDHSEVMEIGDPDVVVDVMACDPKSGEPALSLMLDAFEHGAHVVTANKTPLARSWAEVMEAARRAGRRLGYASAAGAALPAVAVAKTLSRVDRVTSFEGVLTGTTTFVLDEMAGGVAFEDAVQRAQEQGIAEPDPAVDLGGWDTAAKVVILANTLWGTTYSLDDVDVTGLSDDLEAMRDGRTVRLVGRAESSGNLAVGPILLAEDHPLAALKGRDKGIVFEGPAIGRVLVAGGRSHPQGAAAAVLGDVVEVAS